MRDQNLLFPLLGILSCCSTALDNGWSELDRCRDLLHASWSLVEDEAEKQTEQLARASLAGPKLCVVVKYDTRMNLCGDLFSLLWTLER
jgi:hypothetical protein